MKALSIKQPWAWLIVNGHKDIENRTWPTDFRGRIYVHAGQRWDYQGQLWLSHHHPMVRDFELRKDTVPCGGLVGEVDIIGCVSGGLSPWFEGPYGFVLANPVAYETPIPCKGKLGFFEPEIPAPAIPEAG